MKLPQIRMESQFAKIAITQTKAELQIEQPKADISIEQPKADLSIRTTKGKLTIDQTAAWEQMNIYGTQRAIEKEADEGKRAVSEGTARRAEQGAQLIDIHDGINQIAEISAVNGTRPMKQLNIGFIPKPFSVNISYEKGDVDIDIQANKPNIDVQVRKPEVNYYPGSVDISMEQFAQLNIDYINSIDA